MLQGWNATEYIYSSYVILDCCSSHISSTFQNPTWHSLTLLKTSGSLEFFKTMEFNQLVEYIRDHWLCCHFVQSFWMYFEYILFSLILLCLPGILLFLLPVAVFYLFLYFTHPLCGFVRPFECFMSVWACFVSFCHYFLRFGSGLWVTEVVLLPVGITVSPCGHFVHLCAILVSFELFIVKL